MLPAGPMFPQGLHVNRFDTWRHVSLIRVFLGITWDPFRHVQVGAEEFVHRIASIW